MTVMTFLAFADIQLLPDGTVFIHIALILLMIWILNRTFFRPINRVIEEREKNQGGGLSEAEDILQEVGEKEARYNEAKREARSSGYSLIEKERAKAISKKQKKISAAKEEVAGHLAEENAELENQTAAARQAIAAEAEKMAEKISSNILKA